MAPSTLLPAVAAAADELRSSMGGSVLVATDTSYDDARRIWNGAVDRHPAMVARCEDDRDVAAAVRTAREHDLPLSVRGGGHDWAGRSIREGGVLIDLSAMRRVTVDAGTATAEVQGGVLAGEVVAAAGRHGFAPVTGTVKQVGLTGLTLAGGYGLLIGGHGLALDNLLSARVVLADGRQVTASAEENPDLYWALRGGGGNFGVVTAARFRVHPIRSVLAGLLLYPLAAAPTVLRGYRELLAEAPDELTVMAGFFGGPDGQPLLFLLPCWSGEPAQGEPFAARLAQLGTPVAGQVGPMAYRDVLGMFDDSIVNGRHNEIGTRWLPELTEDTTSLLIAAASSATSPFSGLFVHHFHGAATRVQPGDTAFALRRDHLLIEIAAAWESSAAGSPSAGSTSIGSPSADSGAAHRQWVRTLSDELAPFALPGGYPNLLGPAENGRALLAYGPNASRLLELKRRFDPDGVFNAVPALTPTAG